MAKRAFLAGATSQTMDVFLQDSSSTIGAGLSGLVFNTANLKAYYRKGATGTLTAITLATQTVGGAWSSGGFVEIDATNAKGLYRFDIPDTILASTPAAVIHFYGATNLAQNFSELEVVSYNPFDAVRLGLTALPNAAAEAAGGLYTRGTGAGQINQDANGRVDTNTKTWNALTTVALPLVPTVAGRTLDVSAGGEAGVDWANVGSPTTAVNLSATTTNLVNTVTTYTSNTPQTGDSFARIGAAGVGLTAVALTGTQTFNNTGTWTGNVVGTVSTLTTYTGNTPQTGDSFARIGAAGASLTSVALTSAYDFAKGTVAVTESYSTDGAAPTPVQAIMLILQMLTESSIASTTLTVKKLDGSTVAATFALNSSTAPTSITRTT